MKRKIAAGIIVGTVAALAATGLVFLWACTDSPRSEELLGNRWMFCRQLAWMVIGAAAFCLATMASWRSWLKAAPFVAVAWLAMYAVASFQPIDSPSLFLRLGPIGLNVMVMLPFAAALFFAWIVEKSKLRARTALVVAFAALSAYGAGLAFANNANKERLVSFGRGESPNPTALALARGWAQKQYADAQSAAHWFCGNEDYMRSNPIPERFSGGMPASAALTFGKWFNAFVLMLFGLLAFALAWYCRMSSCESRKAYVAVMGLGAVIPAVAGYGGCAGFFPAVFVGVPLVSYGGTALFVAGLASGAFVSLVRDGGVRCRD